MKRALKTGLKLFPIIAAAILSVFSCENFMSEDENLQQVIDDAVTEANAHPVTVSIPPVTGGVTSLTAVYQAKVGIEFPITAYPENEYEFDRWMACVSTPALVELPDTIVLFSNPGSPTTRVKILVDQHDLEIRPVFGVRPRILSISPVTMPPSIYAIRNTNIVITFSKNINLDSFSFGNDGSGNPILRQGGLFRNISIRYTLNNATEFVNAESVFADPQVTGNILTIANSPGQQLPPWATVYVSILSGIRDMDDLSMSANYDHSFVTGTSSDNQPPVVSNFEARKSEFLPFAGSMSDADEPIRRMNGSSVWMTMSASDVNTGGGVVQYIYISEANRNDAGAVLASSAETQHIFEDPNSDSVVSFVHDLQAGYSGRIRLNIRVVDSNGQSAPLYFDFVRDLAAPAYSSGINLAGLGVGANFNLSSNGTINLTNLANVRDANYTATPGVFRIWSNDVLWQYSIGSETAWNGTWLSVSPNTLAIPAGTAGTNPLYIRFADDLLNTSASANLGNFTVDTVLPAAPAAVALSGADSTYYHNASSTQYFSYNASINFTASGGSDTGGSGFRGYTADNGASILASPFNLAPGTYSLRAADNATNLSAGALSVEVVRDTIVPTAPGTISLSGADATYYHNASTTRYFSQNGSISFTASGGSDAGSGFSGYTIDSGATILPSPFTLAAGTTYNLRAMDNCDNLSAPLTVEVAQDTTAPTLSTFGAATGSGIYAQSATTYFITGATLAFTPVATDGSGSGIAGYNTTGTITPETLPLSLGLGTNHIYAIDNVGHVTDLGTITVTRDITAPTGLALGAPTTTAYPATAGAGEYFAKSPATGVSFQPTATDSGCGLKGYNFDGTSTVTVNPGDTMAIPYSVDRIVYAVDNLGNASQVTVDITSDNAGPGGLALGVPTTTAYPTTAGAGEYFARTPATGVSFQPSSTDTGCGLKGYNFDGSATVTVNPGDTMAIPYSADRIVYAVDNLGNTSQLVIDITQDDNAPTGLALRAPTTTAYPATAGAGEYFAKSPATGVSFQPTATDSGCGLKGYNFDGASTVTVLPNGTMAIPYSVDRIVYAVDNLGNASQVTIDITQDNDAPTGLALGAPTTTAYPATAGAGEYFAKSPATGVSFQPTATDSGCGLKGYNFDGTSTVTVNPGDTMAISYSVDRIVYAVDNLGNASQVTVDITSDNAGPGGLALGVPTTTAYPTTAGAGEYFARTPATGVSFQPSSTDTGCGLKGYNFDGSATVTVNPGDTMAIPYSADRIVYAVDNLGNTSQLVIDITQDDNAPTGLALRAPTTTAYPATAGAGEYFAKSPATGVSFQPTATDSGCGLKGYNFDGASTVTVLPNGTMAIPYSVDRIVYAVDNLGNASQVTIDITQDNDAPTGLALGAPTTTAYPATAGAGEYFAKSPATGVSFQPTATDSGCGLKGYNFDGTSTVTVNPGDTMAIPYSADRIVYAVDNLGNASQVTVDVTLDDTPPTITGAGATPAASVLESGTYYTLAASLDFTPAGDSDAGGSGLWGYTTDNNPAGGFVPAPALTATVNAGQSLYAVDHVGNVSGALAGFAVVTDNNDQTVTGFQTKLGIHYASGTPNYLYYAGASQTVVPTSDPGSGCSIKGYSTDNNASVEYATGASIALNSGVTSLTLYAIDQLDQISAPLTMTVTSDSTPPTITGAGATPAASVLESGTYYTLAASLGFEPAGDGDAGGSGLWGYTTDNNPAGGYVPAPALTVTVNAGQSLYAVDLVGNVSGALAGFAVVTDNTDQTVTGFTGANTYYRSGSPNRLYYAGTSQTVTIDGNKGTGSSLKGFSDDTNPDIEYGLTDTITLNSAVTSLTLYAVDQFDQLSTALTVTVTSDSTPPTITGAGATPAASVLESGTYYTLAASLDFTPAGDSDAGGSGLWGYTTDNNPAGGFVPAPALTATVNAGQSLYAVDHVGNVSGALAGFAVVTDNNDQTVTGFQTKLGIHYASGTPNYLYYAGASQTVVPTSDPGSGCSIKGYSTDNNASVEYATGASIALNSGVTSLTLYAIDQLDQISAPLTMTVTSDSTPPTITGAGATPAASVLESGTYYTLAASLGFEPAGDGDAGGSGLWGYTTDNNPAGGYVPAPALTVTVNAGQSLYAVDLVGNVSGALAGFAVVTDNTDQTVTGFTGANTYYRSGSPNRLYYAGTSQTVTIDGNKGTGSSLKGFSDDTNPDIEYGLTDTITLNSGVTSLTLYAVDQFDQLSTALTVTVTSDSTPPTITGAGATPAASVLESGTYYTLAASLDFTPAGDSDAGGSGLWGYTTDNNPAGGFVPAPALTATVNAGQSLYAVDHVGNVSGALAGFAVVTDNNDQTVTGFQTKLGIHYASGTPNYLYYAGASQTVVPTSDPGSGCSIKGYSTDNNASVEYATGASIALNSGVTSLTLYAIDQLDQISAPLTMTVTSDSTPPTITGAGATPAASVLESGTYYTLAASLGFEPAGDGDAGGSGLWGYTTDNNPAGGYVPAPALTVTVNAGQSLYAVDLVGNVSGALAGFAVVTDNTDQTVTGFTGANTYYRSGSPNRLYYAGTSQTVTIDGNKGTGSSLKGFSDDTNPDIEYGLTDTITLNSGVTSLTLYAVDQFDQLSTALTVTVVNDATKPTIPDATLSANSASVSGISITDGDSGILSGSSNAGTFASPYSSVMGLSALPDNSSQTIILTITDRVGNISYRNITRSTNNFGAYSAAYSGAQYMIKDVPGTFSFVKLVGFSEGKTASTEKRKTIGQRNAVAVSRVNSAPTAAATPAIAESVEKSSYSTANDGVSGLAVPGAARMPQERTDAAASAMAISARIVESNLVIYPIESAQSAESTLPADGAAADRGIARSAISASNASKSALTGSGAGVVRASPANPPAPRAPEKAPRNELPPFIAPRQTRASRRSDDGFEDGEDAP